MAAGKKAARVGVAAFALGLSLAGPHAGVAAAETQDDEVSSRTAESSASSASASTQGARANRSKARGSAAGRAGAERGSTRADIPTPAAARSPRAAAAIPGPARRAASQTNDSPAPAVSVPEASAPGVPLAGGSDTQPDATVALPSVTDTADAAPVAAPTTRMLPSLVSATIAVPKLSAAAVMANPVGSIDTAVQNFFTRVSDWLENLPANQITTFLEGALLLVRRNFFNQVAIASPVQTSYNPEDLSAEITGSVGAEDPEGEALTYAVVQDPERGTVTLDAAGQYVYTPAEGFAGQDSFVVKVTSAGKGVNLLHLGAGRSINVTIQVGDNAPTNPFASSRNIRDVALFLGGVPVLLSVGQANMLTGRQTASISLRASDDNLVTWLDYQGNAGTISVADVAAQWDSFESAGNVRLGVDFALEDGTDASVILTSVQGTYISESATYVFSGDLAPDPANGEGIDSYYDIIGQSYESAYEVFRSTYLNDPTFKGLEFVIEAADIYADTYSLRDYEAALKGTDPGIALVSPQGPLDAAGLAAVSSSTSPAVTNLITLADGRVVMGVGTGEVKLWSGKAWISLKDTGWSSPVNTMMPYEDGFVLGLGSGAVQQWAPISVNDVTDGLAPSAFTAYAPNSTKNLTPDSEGAAKAFDNNTDTKYLNFAGAGSGVTIDLGIAALVNGLGLTTANDVENRDPAAYQIYGSSDGATYTLISEGALTPPADRKTDYGDISFANTTAYRYYRVVFPTVRAQDGGIGCATGCMQIGEIRLPGAKPDWTELQGTGWEQPVSTMMPYKDGFVVGLGKDGTSGGVMQWTGTEWKELQGTGWKSPVTTMIPFERSFFGEDGFIVGLGNGSVQQWTGNGWKELQGTGWKSPVTAMTSYRYPGTAQGTGNLVVVGLGNGSVQQWTGFDWMELKGTGWKSSVKSILPSADGYGVVVGLGNGSVQQYTQQGGWWVQGSWTELKGSAWNQPATTMIPLGGGFVVGLGGSTKGGVQYWDRHPTDAVVHGFGKTYTAVAGPEKPRNTSKYVLTGVPNSDEGVTQAFDGSFNTKYLNVRGPGSGVLIDLGAGNAHAVDGLILYTPNDAPERDPASYEIYGSADGNTFSLISAGDLKIPADRKTAYPPVEFENATAYRYYKLVFPELSGADPCAGDTGSTCMQVAEIELTGVPEKPAWKQLQGVGWSSAVTAMTPYKNGFLVGLANGAVEQWAVGDTDSGWLEWSGNQIPFNPETLKAAIKFAEDGGKPISGDTFNLKDPLFGINPKLQPKCVATNDCDGSLYPVTYVQKPQSLKGTSFALGGDGQSLDLSYDLGYLAHGYVYVPGGLWAKLKPSKYAAGVLTSLTTGPSLTLKLGKGEDVPDFRYPKDGPGTIASGTLLTVPTPPVGIFTVDGSIEAEVTAKLLLEEGFTKDKLSASIYYTAGVLTTFNTATGNGFRIGFDSYGPTPVFDDFLAVKGITITPTLTPSIMAKWGLATPASTPIIGEIGLFALGLGYSNPLELELMLQKDTNPSLTFSSTGLLDFSAGLLPGITTKLTYEDSWKLYEYKSNNLWTVTQA